MFQKGSVKPEVLSSIEPTLPLCSTELHKFSARNTSHDVTLNQAIHSHVGKHEEDLCGGQLGGEAREANDV